MKRLGICVFFDKEGITDKYVCYFLQELLPFLTDLCIVINGKITEASKEKLAKYSNNILQRENYGFDAYAYKFALENYGWDKLKEYEEVILFNTTCFAPIFPFKEMFTKIEQKECDFWGLWKWKAPENSKWKKGYHIPSFFFGYRKSLLQSNCLKNYYETMPEIKAYEDAVLYHEQRQTPYFTNKGFKYEVCYNLDEYATDKEYWPHTKESIYVKNERFPFIKRRSFFVYKNSINYKDCKRIAQIIRETKFDANLIIENIVRTQKLPNKKSKLSQIKLLIKIFLYDI